MWHGENAGIAGVAGRPEGPTTSRSGGETSGESERLTWTASASSSFTEHNVVVVIVDHEVYLPRWRSRSTAWWLGDLCWEARSSKPGSSLGTTPGIARILPIYFLVIFTALMGGVGVEQRLVTSPRTSQCLECLVSRTPGRPAVLTLFSGEVHEPYCSRWRSGGISSFSLPFTLNLPFSLSHYSFQAKLVTLRGHVLPEIPRGNPAATPQTAPTLTPYIGPTTLVPQFFEVRRWLNLSFLEDMKLKAGSVASSASSSKLRQEILPDASCWRLTRSLQWWGRGLTWYWNGGRLGGGWPGRPGPPLDPFPPIFSPDTGKGFAESWCRQGTGLEFLGSRGGHFGGIFYLTFFQFKHFLTSEEGSWDGSFSPHFCSPPWTPLGLGEAPHLRVGWSLVKRKLTWFFGARRFYLWFGGRSSFFPFSGLGPFGPFLWSLRIFSLLP